MPRQNQAAGARGRNAAPNASPETLDLAANTKRIHDRSLAAWVLSPEGQRSTFPPPAWWTRLTLDSVTSTVRHVIMNEDQWTSTDPAVRREQARVFFEVFNTTDWAVEGGLWELLCDQHLDQVSSLKLALDREVHPDLKGREATQWCVARPPTHVPLAAGALRAYVQAVEGALGEAERAKQAASRKMLVAAHEQALKEKVAALETLDRAKPAPHPLDQGDVMHCVKALEGCNGVVFPWPTQGDLVITPGVEASPDDIMKVYKARHNYIHLVGCCVMMQAPDGIMKVYKARHNYIHLVESHLRAVKYKHAKDEEGERLWEEKEGWRSGALEEQGMRTWAEVMDNARPLAKRPNLGPEPQALPWVRRAPANANPLLLPNMRQAIVRTGDNHRRPGQGEGAVRGQPGAWHRVVPKVEPKSA